MIMSNKKVYFNIRPTSRERMWDTPKHANKVCEVLLPAGVQQQSSIKTYAASSSFISKVKYEVSKKLINKRIRIYQVVLIVWDICGVTKLSNKADFKNINSDSTESVVL